MIVPTVHRNGTHGPDLLRQVLDAKAAIAKAIEAVNNATPNGRDYYTTGTLAEALAEHRVRLVSLETIKHDYEALAIEISNQLDG